MFQAWLDESKKRLVVETPAHVSGDNRTPGVTRDEYPWVWLRDNCQCSQCYEGISHCRIINLTEFDLSIKPKYVKVTPMVKQKIYTLTKISESRKLCWSHLGGWSCISIWQGTLQNSSNLNILYSTINSVFYFLLLELYFQGVYLGLVGKQIISDNK